MLDNTVCLLSLKGYWLLVIGCWWWERCEK